MSLWTNATVEVLNRMPVDQLIFIKSQLEEFEKYNGGKLVHQAIHATIMDADATRGYAISQAGEQARILSIEENARISVLRALQVPGFGLLALLEQAIQARSGKGATKG